MAALRESLKGPLRHGVVPGPKSAWLVGALATAFLLAACTVGGSTPEEEPSNAPTARVESPGPTAEPAARSDDATPDFELALFETENHRRGDMLRLSQLQGHPVVLNFWFPSCPPCVAEMPDLEKASQKYRGDGVRFVGIQLVGLDTVEDGQEFIDTLGVTYALGPDEDGSIIKSYKVTSFPTTLFLNRDHSLARKWAGFLNAEKIDELMQQLLN